MNTVMNWELLRDLMIWKVVCCVGEISRVFALIAQIMEYSVHVNIVNDVCLCVMPLTRFHSGPSHVLQPEEASSPRATAPQPPTPAPQPVPAITQSSVTQEQLIRQQLLAKQKQLLELQQKKIELELEQTKAQLVGETSTSSDEHKWSHRALCCATPPLWGFIGGGGIPKF